MILNGSQRGGGRDLARHLMKPENEHVEVHEIRGFVADTLSGALREAEAVSRGTKCRRFLYSLSLNPPETEFVPIASFESAIDRIEDKLGLRGHPRVVLFHEKQGRRHAHCVWSRINADTMTAARISFDRVKLADISRQLYLEHGWRMPEGLIDPALRNPLNFDRQEWFKAKRAGKDPRDIKAVLQQCWAASDSGRAFRQALRDRGYFLAEGDRRAVVAIDTNGDVYAVARWIGARTKEVAARTADVGKLPSIAATRTEIASLVREKLSDFVVRANEAFAEAANGLEARRLAMVHRHRQARAELTSTQQQRQNSEALTRAARFHTGLRGLWDRILGKHGETKQKNESEAKAAIERDRREAELLIRQQLSERHHLQSEVRYDRRRHVRELALLRRELIASRGVSDPDRIAPSPVEDAVRRNRLRRTMSGP